MFVQSGDPGALIGTSIGAMQLFLPRVAVDSAWAGGSYHVHGLRPDASGRLEQDEPLTTLWAYVVLRHYMLACNAIADSEMLIVQTLLGISLQHL
jgi:hypothetical protein